VSRLGRDRSWSGVGLVSVSCIEVFRYVPVLEYSTNSNFLRHDLDYLLFSKSSGHIPTVTRFLTREEALMIVGMATKMPLQHPVSHRRVIPAWRIYSVLVCLAFSADLRL
jgi:hypothetical protein